MKARQFIHLGNLSDEALYVEVSKGLKLIFENALSIASDAYYLAVNKKKHGCEILQSLAEEEAAKFLMLLDVIRCDKKKNTDQYNRLLKNITNHLARLIYAESCKFCNAKDFGEFSEWINSLRKECYLDGPEWRLYIYRNRLISEREANMYVDYIENEGEYCWRTPKPLGQKWLVALDLVEVLYKVGFSTPSVLRAIATKWRPINITDGFTREELLNLNNETLGELKKEGLILEQPSDIYKKIIKGWLFPLYSQDLSELKVAKSELSDNQNEWTSDYLRNVYK